MHWYIYLLTRFFFFSFSRLSKFILPFDDMLAIDWLLMFAKSYFMWWNQPSNCRTNVFRLVKIDIYRLMPPQHWHWLRSIIINPMHLHTSDRQTLIIVINQYQPSLQGRGCTRDVRWHRWCRCGFLQKSKRKLICFTRYINEFLFGSIFVNLFTNTLVSVLCSPQPSVVDGGSQTDPLLRP